MPLSTLVPLLCTLIVGISAFLLFLIQPLIAKMLLPLFGGASAVWITCSVFFQIVLFLGYVFAEFLIRRTTPTTQRVLYLALLISSSLFFPLGAAQQPSTLARASPTIEIVVRLALAIGIPFMTLSMTASLSQHWFLITGRSEPYRLYAISNLASFLALFSFPLVLEPSLDLSAHIEIWSLLLNALTAITALMLLLWRSPAHTAPRYQDNACRSIGIPADRAFWLCSSACGVILLLAVTNHLSADIAPIPLLWVFPLALYLLTYVVSFSALSERGALFFLTGHVAALAAFFLGLSHSNMLAAMTALLLALLFGCLTCHTELAYARPAADKLSSYYTHIACGGVLGGLFVGLAAPLLFDRYYEIVIAFTAPLIVRIWALERRRNAPHAGRSPLGILAFLLIGLTAWDPLHSAISGDTARRSRNFYGTLSVTDYRMVDPPYRELSHGSTVHGVQPLSSAGLPEPTMYYGRTSGIGLAVASLPESPRTIAVIGLGAGTVAAYARPGDTVHFIELNPEIIRIAEEEFTYIKKSPGRIVLHQADGRLAMEMFPDNSLDLILVDAFNGDAIPTHLITKEAVELYRRKISGAGLLVFHISNRYLDLSPVLGSIAETLKMEAAVFYDSGNGAPLLAPSVYVIAAPSRAFFNQSPIRARRQEIQSRTRVWTDTYSSLWSAFHAQGAHGQR